MGFSSLSDANIDDPIMHLGDFSRELFVGRPCA